MTPLGRAYIAETLEAWGRQEAKSRSGRELGHARSAIDYVLASRGMLLSLIFSALPAECMLVELTPKDLTPELRITDGRSVDEWTTAVLVDKGRSGDDVRAGVGRDENARGPLICAAQGPLGSAPVVIFDGWHRAAIWAGHARRGREYSIAASVIMTRSPVPVWRE